jgi:trans-aconitate 2-methyltransferase
VDLGCGTGELTAILHDRLAATSTLGLDSSDAMLAKCQAHSRPGLRFEKGDLSVLAKHWAEEALPAHARFDVIFSNAALHWVGDHEKLLTELTAGLAPGGQLAVQIPANEDHAANRSAREVAAEARFAAALGGFTHREPVHAPETYARWLYELGFPSQEVRLVVYGHVLASRQGVLEWVKGTLLTDYARRLGPQYPLFLSRYTEVLMQALAEERPYFYPFKRILFWGQRPS